MQQEQMRCSTAILGTLFALLTCSALVEGTVLTSVLRVLVKKAPGTWLIYFSSLSCDCVCLQGSYIEITLRIPPVNFCSMEIK